jgi:hypothetical protein
MSVEAVTPQEQSQSCSVCQCQQAIVYLPLKAESERIAPTKRLIKIGGVVEESYCERIRMSVLVLWVC